MKATIPLSIITRPNSTATDQAVSLLFQKQMQQLGYAVNVKRGLQVQVTFAPTGMQFMSTKLQELTNKTRVYIA